jgi:ribulose-phosphate 3-epimerase
MIEEPGKYTQAFKDAGADNPTVHYEALSAFTQHTTNKSLGMKAGVALNPHTPIELLKIFLRDEL